ncbi:hypothetical protein GOBAR_AA27610 [Gossypium barbadense]|uniref:Ionotropic glutamate receptor C-terminal domain-containing protein n=1 Tax=Gossypium barbadense TaxID=3634 RepID=A0A2P5WPP7_GOSBA|nr:hypothetical protein GOBAR_AA27610 [Gossypium barbadense]
MTKLGSSRCTKIKLLEAKFLAEFANQTKIPVISISAPFGSFSEVKGIAAFIELHKWENIILIHEDDHNGKFWGNFFEEINFQITYKSTMAASSKDDQIIEELHRLKAMETSVFVVHVEPVLASRIFVHAKRLGMVSQGYAWIVTSKSMNHLHNLIDRSSMQGFIGIEGERRVGFWTPTGKFTNKLSHGFAHGRHLFSSSTIDEDLETIMWPGGISTIPKGRMMQMSSKILRIGVTLKNGFPQLLKVDHDLQTNFTIVSGFCIDVFRAAMAGLNYQMSYEFIPFKDNSQNSGETNNNLVYEVYLQKYDAAVEDITITANRSLYLDFTFPFTDMGNSSSTSIWLTSPEEYANALPKGSKNGGVSAIIDEIPYIKIFLEKYPARYSMIGPVMPTTNGLGFGSTMAHDISKEIAKLREDGRLQMLENSWLTIPTTNFDSGDTSNTMNPLTRGDFQGLFLINEPFQL